MNPRAWVALTCLITLACGAFGFARARAVRGSRPVPVGEAEPETHKVTPDMLASAEARAKNPAPTFRLADAQGTTRDLGEMLATGPVVLVFIKDGCPCSVGAQSYFNALHALYGGRLRLLGIVDGDANLARRWTSANHVPFPMLPDPDLTTTRGYGATNSAFVALVGRDGRIDALWPGYSADMLRDLNRRAAAQAGLPELSIDTSDAPDDLYSGCPY